MTTKLLTVMRAYNSARAEVISLKDQLHASEQARQRAERALWFEHYGDVYPEARVDHGDCEACRCLAALAPGEPK